MKVRLERDVLAEAVQWAARSLPLRPSVPILAGLLVRADAEGVTFSSFDYETSAQIQVKAAVADEGVALDGKLVKDLPASAQDKLHPQTRTQRVVAYKPLLDAALGIAAHAGDLPVVRLDDRPADRETHPHAARLGGEQRIEDPVGMIAVDPRARVGHRHDDVVRVAGV